LREVEEIERNPKTIEVTVNISPGFDSRPAPFPRPSRKKIFPRCRSHLPSSGRKNTQQENIPRKNNVCIVREITKINKKSAGHGTNI
jgi:hypothetical protein